MASPAPNRFRELPLALLRMVIGWHFLYEGATKLLYPGWTASGYLQSSTGPLAPLFYWMSSQAELMRLVDGVNVWGMLAIGLGLMLGVAIRPAAISGMALLALYYLSYPPFFAPMNFGASEGSYLIVNKNLVELFALSVVVAFPAAGFGLQQWWANRKKELDTPAALAAHRRELLTNMAGMPVLGAFVLAVMRKHGWKSFEEANLTGRKAGDTFVASATLKNYKFTTVSELKGQLPRARIGNVELSRMILGGNLIGGWAHARDLIYVSKLVKAYHHREKVFQTLALAEACGVNTLLTNPQLSGIINDYWRNGGKIQFISDCGGEDVITLVKQSIDRGACACYIQGGVADELVEEGDMHIIAEALDLIRKNGLPGGIGAHKLKTVVACVEEGLRPDFWMKTLHQVNYWSARPGEKECDNIWCEDPPATVDYMSRLAEPWIAFKVLAAGALKPRESFQYAFESGADFICVGMYDFQIVDDVNIALDVLRGPLTRQRVWRA